MQIPLEKAVTRRLDYPETPRSDQVDVLHGVPVADPYRWLEDLDSPQTRAWVEAQNQVTTGYMHSLPEREPLRRRLTELWRFERWSVPIREGGRVFFTRNDGLQDQGVLYVLDSDSIDGRDGEPRVVIDPNTLSQDGTVALASFNVSPDGKLIAYGLAHAGSDWQEWKVREVDSGRDLPDHLRWVKFSQSSWTHDNAGFFYCRYEEAAGSCSREGAHFWQKLCYHRLGTPQEEDVVVYHRRDDKEMGFIPYVSDDGRYLFIHIWKGTDSENAFFYKDLGAHGGLEAPAAELLGAFDACYTYVGSDGPMAWFVADCGAPRGRLIAVDVRDPARERWRELIPESAETLQGVSCIGGKLIAHYLKDAYSQVRVLTLDGVPMGEIELPGLGSVSGFYGRREDRETFFCFTSYTVPGTIFRWDATRGETGETSVFRQPALSFDPDDYETRQVFYPSRDGTRVPMFLTARKGTPLDGGRPTYLYGYGGFNTSMTPCFSLPLLVWMEQGGIYAVANLRGGGEYGEEWHQAGSRRQKQNTFDDFVAAAEWLIASGTTAHGRLAIGGHSNGGLLAAATLVQCPDLCAAVLVGVGVLDMLRFHLFTIGWGWVSDYGSPDHPEEFAVLYAYSPYHNVCPGERYPAVLITTADHDDRVVPAHSFKFAAALQHCQAGPEPVLIRIETRAGHGSGKPTSKQIEEAADELSFLWSALTPAE
jgi:prolyl oligopeptidase